jgi:thiol-disulfide isomerase/thioredoxin
MSARFPPGRSRAAVLGTLLLGALLLVAALAFGGPAAAQDDWRLPGLSGGALTAGDVASGTTIVVLWAGWSPRCQDIVERSNRLVGKWGGRARVVLVDFQEEAGEVKAFLAGKDAQAPIYLDGDGAFAKRYALANLPGLLVLRDGAALYAGRLPDQPDSLIDDKLAQR